jgi:hypothetical protein
MSVGRHPLQGCWRSGLYAGFTRWQFAAIAHLVDPPYVLGVPPDEKRHWDANLALAIKVITTEDFTAGRTMQIGFDSGAQSHVVYGRNEPALAHYHKSIRRALGLPVHEGPLPVRVAAE